MSAHGDYEDLCQYLSCQNPAFVSQLFVVHGDYDVQQDFAKRLERKGFTEVIVQRDYPVIFGTLFIFTLLGLLLRLIGDVLYQLIDPRIHFDSQGRG